MPFRVQHDRTVVHFLTSLQMPNLAYQACLATGIPSNTRYYQLAICAALARDLDLDLDELVAALPPTRGPTIFGGRLARERAGPGNTVEEVR